MDGSVASIKFGENELGRMMSVMEMVIILFLPTVISTFDNRFSG
jgi:hypothetical protein